MNAAQGLGGQRRGIPADIDGGRVELDELRIGDHRAGQSGHAEAFAFQLGGGGGDGVEAADAAGRQDRRRAGDLQPAALPVDGDAAHPADRVLQQAAQAGARPDLDVPRGQHAGGDGAHDRRTRLVATDARDAGTAVRGLQALSEAAGFGPVEGRA
jgi:hypothetical protein